MKKTVSADPSRPDIVLIGSEIEGIYLADAAREEGLSVVILDPREKPGGQLIQGQMLYLDEPQSDSGRSLLQGKVKTLFDAYKDGSIRKSLEFESYYNKLIEGIPMESGITITKLEVATDSSTSLKQINQLHYRTKDGQEKSITAKYFVENTDFAAMTSRLGLSRIQGVELVFGGAKDYMASSLMMKFKNVDWNTFKKEVNNLSRKEIEEKYGSGTTVTEMFTWGFSKVGARYKPTTSEVFLRGLNTVNQLNGEAMINALLVYNVDAANPDSLQKAKELGRSETALVLQHLRKELPGWEKAELNGYPDYLYIRDYDRYETEYVLEASDLMSGKTFWDNVSIAGYPLDLQGTQNSVWGSSKGDPDLYGMPLRSFISKGFKNVIVAGKNVGATGPAYGSARIQPNTALAGEVIGYLLGYIEDKHELTLLTKKQMNDFHESLKKRGLTISGVQGKDKIKHLTPEQLEKLNRGSFVVK
ncbi:MULTISPECIES: FAD-dependent oxidoreductase [unclassified Paenibacillus]|uniref:FAD-dependent oxidoreductase n=1 Tax=unclassified Paenibacillus TaxID=185978 RepID=UPI0027D912F2|nr:MULTISPECIES: FAD-dependent oxidoreductase [unclassified Paenibacillus]